MDNIDIATNNVKSYNYSEIKEKNLEILELSEKKSELKVEGEIKGFLREEERIKAVAICFSDIEGRFHMLDYDKNFFLKSADNLTFDGSSVRGFSELKESDLRLIPDWGSTRVAPEDIFGIGKVIMFADVYGNDNKPYHADFRAQLKEYAKKLEKTKGLMPMAAAEVEGFLMDGQDAEQNYTKSRNFKLISSGGYYHSLPLDSLKQFIDKAATVQRVMAFNNEKDHPEVAPSQFEMNFSYTDVVRACDNISLYKLICRQVAENMGMTATFLPKPKKGINGNGMHLNISFSKGGKNIFYDKKGKDGLSKFAWDATSKILNHASELCLIFNSSVNSYRRLDPNFEAPNQIEVSAKDRGSMIRIPVGNEKTARFEVRSVAPDANSYLAIFSIVKTIIEGEKEEKIEKKRERVKFLSSNIHDAIRQFRRGELTGKILGEEAKESYLNLKEEVADRSPKELGRYIKKDEILFHHEVTNQVLWDKF